MHTTKKRLPIDKWIDKICAGRKSEPSMQIVLREHCHVASAFSDNDATKDVTDVADSTYDPRTGADDNRMHMTKERLPIDE